MYRVFAFTSTAGPTARIDPRLWSRLVSAPSHSRASAPVRLPVIVRRASPDPALERVASFASLSLRSRAS